jgi:hypothetical protein
LAFELAIVVSVTDTRTATVNSIAKRKKPARSSAITSMAPSDRRLLLERVVPDRVEHSTAAQGPVVSDLNMMVIGGGRERTATEHRALLEPAGFTLTKIILTQSEVSVIEAEPV